jgi:Protein of unknown function (DUF3563)
MNPVFKPDSSHPEFLQWRLQQSRLHRHDRTLAGKHLHASEHTLDSVFSAWSALRATLGALKDRVFPPTERQRDAYLAEAVDRIDLEQRIRNWERRPTAFRDGA